MQRGWSVILAASRRRSTSAPASSVKRQVLRNLGHRKVGCTVKATRTHRFVHRSSYLVVDPAERVQKTEIRRRIINAYKGALTRWYARIRFLIINQDFLDALEQHLPQDGQILDIGCGFGLFALYYAMTGPRRTVSGFDLYERRINQSNEVAQKLGVRNAEFFAQDATTFGFAEAYDAIVTMDLLHHVGADVAESLIRNSYRYLVPGGILVVKDVDTRPLFKLWFTYLLDKFMMWRLPVHYRSASDWRAVMERAGFDKVFSYPLKDALPYPHVLIVAHKSS